jgi:hypothetical protein
MFYYFASKLGPCSLQSPKGAFQPKISWVYDFPIRIQITTSDWEYLKCITLEFHILFSSLSTMCGSRTGGWSLPCVMSDWQRCVDWFLAKYCRCRLRLDSCWCRWRTSAKGRRRWGLEVWRRQVGFVGGTRWPAGSSVGRMVAWTARWSHGQFLGRASKPSSSQYYVGAKSWVEIGGGYTEFTGFAVFTRKLVGYSVELQNRGWRLDEEVRPPHAGSTTQEGRSDRLGPVKLPGPV